MGASTSMSEARKFSAMLVGSIGKDSAFLVKVFDNMSVEVEILETEQQLFSSLEKTGQPDFLFLDGDLPALT